MICRWIRRLAAPLLLRGHSPSSIIGRPRCRVAPSGRNIEALPTASHNRPVPWIGARDTSARTAGQNRTEACPDGDVHSTAILPTPTVASILFIRQGGVWSPRRLDAATGQLRQASGPGIGDLVHRHADAVDPRPARRDQGIRPPACRPALPAIAARQQ